MKLKYTLVLGDSEDKLKTFSDNSIDLCVTSPPYYTMRGAMQYESYESYLDKMGRIFVELYRVLEPRRVFALNVTEGYMYNGIDYDVGIDLYNLARKVGFISEEKIVWTKPSGLISPSGTTKRFGNFLKYPYPFYYKPNRMWEFIFIFTKGSMTHATFGEKSSLVERSRVLGSVKQYSTNVWYLSPSSTSNSGIINFDGSLCTAMFPLALPDRVIKFYSLVGDVVLDPFLGSGTTMLAAKNNQRSCIGIELNPDMVPLIKKKVGWLQNDLDGMVEYEIDGDGGSEVEEGDRC